MADVINIGVYQEKHRLMRARGIPDWFTCETCGRLTETWYRTQNKDGTWGPRLCEACDIALQIADNVANGWSQPEVKA